MSEQLTYPVNVIAQLLDLSDRRVQQLANDGVIPKSERGRYHLIKSVRGYINFLRAQLPNSGKPVADIREAAARLKSAQANIAELEEAKLKGRLLDAEEVYRQDHLVMRTIRDSIMAIGDRLAPILASEQSESRVYDLLRAEFEATVASVIKDWERQVKAREAVLKEELASETGSD